ncbi:MAG: benzoyl-CoA-dihydrodiol lyase [Deltaproteobacteria bacterium]|nr:benzoyl-CoA-dihydrodiol lyase [Deltaproteobacteria bacterium]
MAEYDYPPVDFETHPSRYKHWDLSVDGDIARLTMHIKDDQPMWPGKYELKLNSYDLSVDIELNDAINRLRWEHPQVRAVVVSGAYDKVFCAGANIRMLGMAPHAFKVNFCKYTNETRGMLEESSAAGQVFIAALNGTASGGGYELALACDQILLIDDGNAAVSLPEVPLLGVLPGTGGLTRLTDKRKVRRDVADVFCTKAEGFRAKDAKRMRLIDQSFPRSQWQSGVAAFARATADKQAQRAGAPLALPPLQRTATKSGWQYPSVHVEIDGRVANLRLFGPTAAPSRDAQTWAMRFFRELEDALLRLRLNHLEVGLIVIRSEGDPAAVLAADAWVDAGIAAGDDFYFAELRRLQARVLRKLDNMAKSVFTLVEAGHCFVGSLTEVIFASDRAYMFQDDDGENALQLSALNFGAFTMANDQTRVAARFPGEPAHVEALRAQIGATIDAEQAMELGLVTASLDEIDYDDEVRIAIEERSSLSPDALTGMEQNLRFGGGETTETKIYGRLTAWQNWIFQRPNAVGDRGALSLYGHPERPVFDYRRT